MGCRSAVATGTSDIGRSRYPALGFDEFGFGGFAEEEGEGRPQQKCGRWAPGVANLFWVVKHEAHEGSWSGRHGTDRKGPAWHGKRQDRPGGQSIEVTRLATSHGVMVKILVGLDYP